MWFHGFLVGQYLGHKYNHRPENLHHVQLAYVTSKYCFAVFVCVSVKISQYGEFKNVAVTNNGSNLAADGSVAYPNLRFNPCSIFLAMADLLDFFAI